VVLTKVSLTRQLTSLAMPLGALNAGAENGERGYFLTFVIAYIRDFGLDFR
jgi:alkyldihydroxyacetonephosphate synthase